MSSTTHLCFNYSTIRNKAQYQGGRLQCPFCDRKELASILHEDGELLLVENKFQTLADTYQTVIVETADCDADMTTYSPEHMQRLIVFGTDHWLRMEESGEFASVVFYKNHGPLSGGTIKHAHMQIVGLRHIDYRRNLNDAMFQGIEIHTENANTLTISTTPYACATEYNIITPVRDDGFMARNIQILVRHVLQQCNSFNLFFYQWGGGLLCKVVPRYVASPFLMGYAIPQTSNHLQHIAEELKNRYYAP